MLVLRKLSRYNVKSFGNFILMNTRHCLGYNLYTHHNYKVIRYVNRSISWRLIYNSQNYIKRISLSYTGYKSSYIMYFEENYADSNYRDNLLTITNLLADIRITISKQIFTPEYRMLNQWTGL